MRCEIKITSEDPKEIVQSDTRDNKEAEANLEYTNEEDWSSTCRQNTESGSEDNFSLMPDSDLSRSSEATSDKDSVSSDIYVDSEQDDFAIKQVELGRLQLYVSS